jgi:MazG family protein
LKQRLQIKAAERKTGESQSALGNVPKAMPALARAQSVSRRASHLGFDWPDIEPVWKKIFEEIGELKTAVAAGHKARSGEELGDLLFSLVNLARFLDVEAEDVLAQTIDRFTRRFHYIETKLRQANKNFDETSLEEMDRLWEEAKKLETAGKNLP